MIVEIIIPGPPPKVPTLETTSKAESVTDDVSKAYGIVTEASDWAHKGGAPADWDGEAADAAKHARSVQMDHLSSAVAALERAQRALKTFTSQMEGLRSTRTTLGYRGSALSGRRDSLEARSTGAEGGYIMLMTEAQELSDDIDAFSNDLDDWQNALTAAEDVLIAALEKVDTTPEGEWASSTIVQVHALISDLIARGVLPPGAENWSASRFKSELIKDPDIAKTLMLRRPFPDMAGAVGRLALLSPESPGWRRDQHKADQLRALFESLPPEEASLLAMLYPDAVRNVSGVPFEHRADANLVAVVAERATLQSEIDDIPNQMDHYLGPNRDGYGNGNTEVYDKMFDAEIADADARMTLYDSIINDKRQIVFFDPSGDGAIAELHGKIDANTRNVGVLVPGTKAEMANFQEIANRSNSFLENSNDLAMISWMGGDFPDGIGKDAPNPKYAQSLAPLLAEFSHDVRQEINHSPGGGNDISANYLGHSYGGAATGLAETHGLDADRVLHVASAGAGKGVDSVDDLPSSQDDVDRYSMIAPGDMISKTQGVNAGDNIGHGANPDGLDGTIRLETGNKADGSPNTGNQAHSGVFEPHSDAWDNMLALLNGEPVLTHSTLIVEVVPTAAGTAAQIPIGLSGGEWIDLK